MQAKYKGLDQSALQAFKGCHNRVRSGKAPFVFWPRTAEGYLAFLAEVGPPPEGMQKPSLGRINHILGYQPGNIRWEEHKHNSVKRRGTKHCLETSAEVELRKKKFSKGTPEHLNHQRLASQKRWANPQQRIALSERMKGNTYASLSR
jgi:hypothetical protein